MCVHFQSGTFSHACCGGVEKEAVLRMYGMAMEALNPGAAPPTERHAEGGELGASLMGDDFPSQHHKALTYNECATLRSAPTLCAAVFVTVH